MADILVIEVEVLVIAKVFSKQVAKALVDLGVHEAESGRLLPPWPRRLRISEDATEDERASAHLK